MKKTFEKKYLSLFKQHQKGQLTSEEFENQCTEISYEDDNNVLHQISPSGLWYQWVNNDWVFESYLTGNNRRKLNLMAGYSKPRVWTKVLAVFLVFAFMVTFVFPDAISDGSVAFRGWIQELKVYKSPSMKQEFLPGLVVKAPRGAMKEGQSIEVEEVLLNDALNAFADAGEFALPLYAFDFDADMESDETFIKPVEIEIDLSKLTVSDNSYEDLIVSRLGSNNEIELLETRVKGNKLIITTEKNSIVVILLWLGKMALAVGVGAAVMLEAKDEYAKFGSNYFEYNTYVIPVSKYKNYYIHCHEDYVAEFDNAMEVLKSENDKLMSKYGVVWSDTFHSYTTPVIAHMKIDQLRGIDIASLERNNEIIRNLQNDPDYIKLNKKITMDLLPPPVKTVAEAVMITHDYLYDERNLKRIPHQLDIVILEPWTYSKTVAAMETTRLTEASFIQINPDIVRTITSGGGQKKAAIDDLIVTVTHEMLHAIQWEYYDGQDLRYSEALAMMFEAEAARYYASKGIIDIGNYKPTKRATDMLNLSWYSDADSATQQEHGYAFSYVLEYQRDSEIGLFGGLNETFLPKLLNSRTTNSSAGAIYSILKDDEKDLMYRFLKSDVGTTAGVRLDINRALNIIRATETIYDFTFEDKPLSISAFHTVIPTNINNAGNKESVILYYKDSNTRVALDMMKQHILYTMIPTDDANFDRKSSWHEMNHSEGLQVVPLNEVTTEGKNKINRIYITDDGDKLDVNKQATIKTIVAVSPDPIADITFDSDEMMFTIKLQPETVQMKEIYQGRVVELSVPGTSIVPYQVHVNAGEIQVKIHLLELLLNEGDESTFNIKGFVNKMISGTMSLTMKTSLRAMALASNGMLRVKEKDDNSMYVGIDESFLIEDDNKNKVSLVEKLREKGFPHGADFSINSDDQHVSFNMVTDYGAYLRMKATLNEMFRYLFFTTFNNDAGIDMKKANKRLQELNANKKVIGTIRNGYSASTVFIVNTAVKVEDSYHKTSESVLGPKSSEKELMMPYVNAISGGIPKTVYTGTPMFKIESNINKVVKEYRADTKEKRFEEQRTQQLEDYLESNASYLNNLREKEGQAAVNAEISREMQSIEEDIAANEIEFDEEFYKAFDEILKLVNNMQYKLVFNGNNINLSVLDVSLTGTYVQSQTPGRYNVTFYDKDKQRFEYEMVLTPEGQIILKGEYIIFK